MVLYLYKKRRHTLIEILNKKTCLDVAIIKKIDTISHLLRNANPLLPDIPIIVNLNNTHSQKLAIFNSGTNPYILINIIEIYKYYKEKYIIGYISVLYHEYGHYMQWKYRHPFIHDEVYMYEYSNYNLVFQEYMLLKEFINNYTSIYALQ